MKTSKIVDTNEEFGRLLEQCLFDSKNHFSNISVFKEIRRPYLTERKRRQEDENVVCYRADLYYGPFSENKDGLRIDYFRYLTEDELIARIFGFLGNSKAGAIFDFRLVKFKIPLTCY